MTVIPDLHMAEAVPRDTHPTQLDLHAKIMPNAQHMLLDGLNLIGILRLPVEVQIKRPRGEL